MSSDTILVDVQNIVKTYGPLRAVNDLSFKILKRPVAEFRQANGLSPKHKKINTPFLYGISSTFLPKPFDYPPDQYFTGFWISKNGSNLDPEISAFIESSESPLLITFGSMPFKSKISISELAEKIIEKFGIRIILIRAWGVDAGERFRNNSNVFVADNAPYDALLPKLKAVIHHGGVGTVAECLRAGKPMLICPVLYPVGDQQFWGKQTFEKRVGVNPLPLSKMKLPVLLKRIEQLLSDSSLYENAEKIAEKIKKEDGVKNAIQIIEKMVLGELYHAKSLHIFSGMRLF